MRDRYRVSLTKACALFHMSRSLYGYRSVARDSSALLARIKEIAATRVHYGYRRVHVMLQREGWKDNHKRVYRLYRAEGLSLRHKRPKRNKSARLLAAAACFHADQARWVTSHELDELSAIEPLATGDMACVICAHNVKPALTEINSESDRAHDRLLK